MPFVPARHRRSAQLFSNTSTILDLDTGQQAVRHAIPRGSRAGDLALTDFYIMLVAGSGSVLDLRLLAEGSFQKLSGFLWLRSGSFSYDAVGDQSQYRRRGVTF